MNVDERTLELPRTQSSFEDEIDLLDYVEVIIKRRWLIILGVVLFTAVPLVRWTFVSEKKEYRAEANMLLLDNVDPTSGRVVTVRSM